MIFKNVFAIALIILAACYLNISNAQNTSSEYRLGQGDGIRITVFQNPDLTLETRVSENDTVTFPLVGTIKIGGMTISAAEQAVAGALKEGGFIKQPQVSILLLRNLGNQVSILGQVGRPGRFPLETFNIKLSEILALAGGIAPGGGDVLIVTGARNGQPFRKEIDVAAMFLKNNFDDDIIVAGGDLIYVDRHPVFYIYGEVQRPGASRIERGMTVRQALAQSGGPTARGTQRDIEVFRRDAGGKGVNVNLDDRVQPDDVFYVGESLF